VLGATEAKRSVCCCRRWHDHETDQPWSAELADVVRLQSASRNVRIWQCWAAEVHDGRSSSFQLEHVHRYHMFSCPFPLHFQKSSLFLSVIVSHHCNFHCPPHLSDSSRRCEHLVHEVYGGDSYRVTVTITQSACLHTEAADYCDSDAACR